MQRREPMKRTPIRAYSRSDARSAANGIRRLADQVRQAKGIPRTVRDAVLARDGRCLTCGTDRFLVINHRLSGMGGNRPQSPEWLTTACASCNLRYEDSPLTAYERGYKLRLGADPSTPVVDYAGNSWRLEADGSRSPAPGEEAP